MGEKTYGTVRNDVQNRVRHATAVQRPHRLVVAIAQVVVVQDVEILPWTAGSIPTTGQTRLVAVDRRVGEIEVDAAVLHGNDGDESGR